MECTLFRAYAITHEIDLNKIAVRCGIPKKYTWEEPLVLDAALLSRALDKKCPENRQILLFSFGSIVFTNYEEGEENAFLEYLKINKDIEDYSDYKTYTDYYELRIDENTEETELTDTWIHVPEFEMYQPELISTVIAKSVAFERTEEQLSSILDRVESMIDRLDKGKASVSNKELAKTIARVVRHEYNTLAYIMVLDKPDITWQSSNAEIFYEKMSNFFELNDRYQVLKTKTDILNSMLEGVSSISHSRRGLLVEWIVVGLIVLEVVLMVIDLVKP